jgi:hypothetical protein
MKHKRAWLIHSAIERPWSCQRKPDQRHDRLWRDAELPEFTAHF